MQQRVQGGCERFAPLLHARSGNLHGQVVAVAVNDQTGQKIALAVAKSVPGAGVEALAQGQCRFQPLGQQGLVQLHIGLAAVQAGADKRSRIDAHAAKGSAAPVAEGCGLTGAKSVSGLCFTSTSLANTQRCPARRRRSSFFLRQSLRICYFPAASAGADVLAVCAARALICSSSVF